MGVQVAHVAWLELSNHTRHKGGQVLLQTCHVGHEVSVLLIG